MARSPGALVALTIGCLCGVSARSQIATASADDLLRNAATLRRAGRFKAAAQFYERASQAASYSRNSKNQWAALVGASGCYIRLFSYQEALQNADRAYKVAQQSGNDTWAGAAIVNKSSVYFEVGDFAAAAIEAERAVALLEKSDRKDYLTQALLAEGDAHSRLGRNTDARNDLERAAAIARTASLTELEAKAEDHLSEQLIASNDLDAAEKALLRAEQLLTQAHSVSGLAFPYAHFAELRYQRGDFPGALSVIEKVLASNNREMSAVPRYWLLQLKGEALLGLRQQDNALVTFSEAIAQADLWRRDVLPGDSTGTQTIVSLSTLYHNYVALAARMSLERNDAHLARRAFEVLTANRAWILQEQLRGEMARQLLLPPHYYELLEELQKSQAAVTLGRNVGQVQAEKGKLSAIRLELSDLENRIGLQRGSPASEQQDGYRTSLPYIQAHIRPEQLLISFSLGAPQSFVWTVTKTQVHLYALPSSADISAQARDFTDAVQHRQSPAGPAGSTLSHMLFSQFSASSVAKPEWLIAADGALLDGVPFSALPTPLQSGYEPLMDHRTIRLLPSAALAGNPATKLTRGSFVGIADPIYNLADERRTRPVSVVPVSMASTSVGLGRLVGTEREVRSSATVAGLADVQILTGADASLAKLQLALSRKPEIVHFAVHVVSPPAAQHNAAGTSDQAALALSLSPERVPELLTRETIATMRVPGSLVVLSGCASQQGQVLPSAGIVGLSRGWLLAGASAVLVTSWPTPDDSGHFFQSFYASFRTASGSMGQRAAWALQQAQREMRGSSGYRSDASFWSAYSLVSKE